MMGEKRELNRSYGQKLISLFVRLLFSGESYSLTELSRMLECSKQTVLRLIDDIDLSYNVKLEQSRIGNRHYYSIRRPERPSPLLSISEMELSVLQMCRDFTSQFLGKQLFEEATKAILKSQVLVPGKKGSSSGHFATFRPGTIDYTPHHDTIHTVIDAMRDKRVCEISYHSITEPKPKTFNIAPLKLFSHKDTIYLHARLIKDSKKENSKTDFDPLLAVHRIKNVKMLDRTFTPPGNYDFEKIFNQHFGVIKDGAFKVVVEFTGWAAKFVEERIWSPDQKITKKGKGGIVLEFTASSEAEVISWVLSFGEEARLLVPKKLTTAITGVVCKTREIYSISD